MERRKNKFEPEKLDYVKLVENLDWTKEISPVILVKTVNKVAELTGRRKYETNEASYGALVKCFEKRVSQFVDTRIHGKDRFYTLKAGITKDQIVYFIKTGKMMEMEIKEELKKKDSKHFVPEVMPVEEKKVIKGRRKKIFPDDEALSKTVFIMKLLIKGKGEFRTLEYNKIREFFGWKKQRSFNGETYTNFQEANKVSSWLELGELFEICPLMVKLKDPKNISILENKISEISALIDDPVIRKKIEVEFGKDEVRVEEKPVEKPAENEPKKIFKASPEIEKSEPKEIIYEGSKTRWYKNLITATIMGAERGQFVSYVDVSQFIKNTRFVEINVREIKTLMEDIAKKYSGIFREVESGGVTIGNESLINKLYSDYPAEKITETVFIRLKMKLEEIQAAYPELSVKLASEIGEEDNIYEIETNRSERTEKAFAKLIFRMRRGEIILESPTNWTVKRAKILIDKLQNF